MNQDEQALYRRFAHLYDRIYDWKEYAAEAEWVRTALLGAGVREGGRVVEAACGTGSYLVHLNDWYEVSGFDLNPAVLEVARKKIPKVHLFEADMADFELTRPVDAIVCLFSSIGYVPLGEPLHAVAESFYRNVLPGGVVLVAEPEGEAGEGTDGHGGERTRPRAHDREDGHARGDRGDRSGGDEPPEGEAEEELGGQGRERLANAQGGGHRGGDQQRGEPVRHGVGRVVAERGARGREQPGDGDERFDGDRRVVLALNDEERAPGEIHRREGEGGGEGGRDRLRDAGTVSMAQQGGEAETAEGQRERQEADEHLSAPGSTRGSGRRRPRG